MNAQNVSTAWLTAIKYILEQRNLDCFNLMMEILNPLQRSENVQDEYEKFCEERGIKHFSIPAKTIFDNRAYEILGLDRHKLYKKYPSLHKVLRGKWGSYFGQMINWSIQQEDGTEISRNQIEAIIKRINERERIYKSAYTMQIANPLKHSNYIMGGPCLHYIFLQLESDRTMNLLSVYRNHDFAIKAYGNYVGLGHLLQFLCHETDFRVGKLTCVSSHAYITGKYRQALSDLIGGIHE